MKEDLSPCPECGSSNVSRHLIETRPHCNSCGFWSPDSWGNLEQSREEWNRLSKARWDIKEIPNRVKSLEQRVSELEKDKQNIQKMDNSDPPE